MGNSLRSFVEQFNLSEWWRRIGSEKIVLDSKADVIRVSHPFWVMVSKEVSDHVRSWRFKILLILILLTRMGSLYTSISAISKGSVPRELETEFFFLQLFTLSDGTLPPSVAHIEVIGHLVWIRMGFDPVT